MSRRFHLLMTVSHFSLPVLHIDVLFSHVIAIIIIVQAQLSMASHGLGQRSHPSVSQDKLFFTIKSVTLLNQTIPIHKNRYHFSKLLGNGFFGEVYSARRLSDNRPVAIKVVSLATANSAEADLLKRAFLNEVEISNRLTQTSKHIVQMYDFDFHLSGLTFIVMELGQENLEKTLASRPPLTPTERKVIWRQLVNIAVTLHNNQIVHFDIKPDNLVVFPGNIVKLVDMGIARKAQRIRVGPNGTVPYSAPEVTTISHFHTATNSRKADIWSWGAVLYRMTYNVPPNFDYTPPCHYPPPSQRLTRDTQLHSVLRHTLHLNPKRRLDALSLAQHPYTKSN